MRVIAGTAKGTRLHSLKGMNTRPTLDRIKESLFSILMPWIPGAVVIDFFSGSGSLCIEALSRGAKKAYFIESSHSAMKIIHSNLHLTRLTQQAVLIETDFQKGANILAEKEVRGDILFVDPPHAGEMVTQTLHLIEDLHLLQKSGIIVAEHHSSRSMPEKIGSLARTRTKKYGSTTLSFYQRSNEDE